MLDCNIPAAEAPPILLEAKHAQAKAAWKAAAEADHREVVHAHDHAAELHACFARVFSRLISPNPLGARRGRALRATRAEEASTPAPAVGAHALRLELQAERARRELHVVRRRAVVLLRGRGRHLRVFVCFVCVESCLSKPAEE